MKENGSSCPDSRAVSWTETWRELQRMTDKSGAPLPVRRAALADATRCYASDGVLHVCIPGPVRQYMEEHMGLYKPMLMELLRSNRCAKLVYEDDWER